MAQNEVRVKIPGRHFSRNHTHNSKTKGRIKTSYIPIQLFLCCQTYLLSSFGYDILCVLTLVTRKLQVVGGRFTSRTIALLSEMYIFCVRAGCEIRMAIYASKHASEFLSYKQLVRIYTHTARKALVYSL